MAQSILKPKPSLTKFVILLGPESSDCPELDEDVGDPRSCKTKTV